MSFSVFFLLNGCMPNISTTMNIDPAGTYVEENELSGSTVLTAQDRSDLRRKMLSMKSYEECTDYTTQHYQMIVARPQGGNANEPRNRTEICRRMKSAGMFRSAQTLPGN